jgi:hypothetical protein
MNRRSVKNWLNEWDPDPSEHGSEVSRGRSLELKLAAADNNLGADRPF